MKLQEVQSDIGLVQEIASTPAEKRLRHFCRLAHERLITASDLPILQTICKPTFVVEEGGEYPQCHQMIGMPSSYGCAHQPDYWYAVQNSLRYLASQQLTENDMQEVQTMQKIVESDFNNLHGRDGLDIQMAELRLMGFDTMEPAEKQKEKELGDQHSEMVERLFTFSQRIIVLLNLQQSGGY